MMMHDDENEDLEDDFEDDDDGWEERIAAVLGDDDGVCDRNCKRWREHLLKNLTLPVRVTGIEDFPWEEGYVFGGWDEDEYEEMKKTNPSYTDEFDLLKIGPPQGEDLWVTIRRVSDGKEFQVELSWLEACDRESAAYRLLDDYSVWHCC